ncbi:MAG: hypothetical protein RL302_529 [Pseudomonadota bacterium]|jgi:hypothetical protein
MPRTMIDSLSRFASSFVALLSAEPLVNVDGRIDEIRDAMLGALTPYVALEPVLPKAWISIGVATDIQTLWYLRSDLVGLLADYCGEGAAREQVSVITEMFRGIIPHGQFPRAGRIRK